MSIQQTTRRASVQAVHWLSAALAAGLLLLASMGVAQDSSPAARPAWTGAGRYRLLVEVDPRPLTDRERDERPADLAIDWRQVARQLSRADHTPDIRSLQVIQYDRATGQPLQYADYAYQRSDADRPFRWYDHAIPYDFPECGQAVTRTDGRIVRRNVIRGGYFFNVLGDWQAGRLAWSHTQLGPESSHYAIYFDWLPAGRQPDQLPPRGWLGDGLPRCDETGGSTMAADHSRVDVDDWNQDGLPDLIVGEHYGHVLWWPNLGTARQPRFRYAKLILDADGQPLDCGMAAAPKVVDWDGDGRKDLLVGTEWNRILFYRNTGSNQQRRLAYEGPLLLDGQPLELPIEPLERGSSQVFRRDYYPVLETVDWDADGDLDLLAGGYITGRIYWYENTGSGPDGLPRLKLRGPLLAGGQPLNVGHWCAAPCAVDLDGDGDLDLLSGNMPMYATADEQAARPGSFLRYYENRGSRTEPILAETAFPGQGAVPRQRLATPRAVDWDGDGDLDLVVSAREDIFLFENQGTRTAARFALHAEPLRVPWGLAAISADQFRDWDGDGRLDLVHAYTIRLNSGRGNPYAWNATVGVLPPGQFIAHPSGIGDDWFWPFLDDFDQDGRMDVLFGDWHGHVWLHRNLSVAETPAFDLRGQRLRLASGELIKVGPIGKDPQRDFEALQGARTVLTVADFDRDGRRDLLVGDTFGKVRYYRNLGPGKSPGEVPEFAEPYELGSLGIRGLVDATDWNQDGWLDVIASAANGRVRVYLNRGELSGQRDSTARFDEGFDPGLPPIMQPRVLMADLNGDGDDDLFIPGTQGACFVERSFLDGGYAAARLLVVEGKSADERSGGTP